MSAKVLLVDDSPDFVEVMSILLSRVGVPSVSARSFAEVEAQRDLLDDVTLAILDVNLGPGEPSGVDVGAWLRAHGIRCRIVFLTGHAADHPLVRAASQLEDGNIMVKPVESRRLVDLAQGTA
ncbi:MAG TPA: response regulator [Kofleriaceae bacterium]|nr:response regulator [Kofleriaceae bacterium]